MAKKVEEKAISKWTAGMLAVFALSMFLLVGCGFIASNGDGKHTGPVTIRYRDGAVMELIRPNSELFEVFFDPRWDRPHLKVGDVLKDLVYTDTKEHQVFFVKAVLDHESPELPHADRMLYDGSSLCYPGGCQLGNQTAYYLWSDGGYRDKPEKKK